MKTFETILKEKGIKFTETKKGITVGGYLDLRGTGITSLPDNLTIGGSLDLEGCTGITSLPDNLTVGGYLDLRGTGITSLPDNLTVGGSLDLEGTGITSLPDNLTVGGSLDLRGTGITSLPDNLTVGGPLDLEGTGITSLPDNLTVGGSLCLKGTGITQEQREKVKTINTETTPIFFGKNKKYMKIDGVFSEIISHKRGVYKVKMLNKSEVSYIVTDGEGRWSHGETLKDAKDDLMYKISNRNKSDYEVLTKDSILTFEESVVCYRVITGACQFGVKDFIINRLNGNKKDSYTISEISEVTKGEYGNNTFNEFFKIK